jgi:hypothetical protein
VNGRSRNQASNLADTAWFDISPRSQIACRWAHFRHRREAMTEQMIEKTEDEVLEPDLTDELSDEALDRDESLWCVQTRCR